MLLAVGVKYRAGAKRPPVRSRRPAHRRPLAERGRRLQIIAAPVQAQGGLQFGQVLIQGRGGGAKGARLLKLENKGLHGPFQSQEQHLAGFLFYSMAKARPW